MASSNKTSLGLNQWAESDKPRMEDFNKDNEIIDAALAAKTSGKYKIYSGLSLIGLDATCTMRQIHDGMDVNSMMITMIHQANAPNFPHGYGFLTVKKLSTNYSEFRFQQNNATKVWIGSYTRVNNIDEFRGWYSLTVNVG